MAAIDFSFYLPILSFLLVFIVAAAVLIKTEILGDNKFAQIFIAFLIATIFVTVAGARKYIVTITPWFAIFLVALAFILIMIGFFGKAPEVFTKGVGVVFILGLMIVFVVSAYFVFTSSAGPDVLGGGGTGENQLLNWISSPKVYGTIILLVVGVIASWVLVKEK